MNRFNNIYIYINIIKDKIAPIFSRKKKLTITKMLIPYYSFMQSFIRPSVIHSFYHMQMQWNENANDDDMIMKLYIHTEIVLE